MTGTSAPTTTLAAAQAALTGHDAQRERWAGTVARLTAQLRTHETGAVRAALDGTATGKLATDGGRLREELRIAEEAVALLDGEREEVAYGVKLAEQRDRREQSEALVTGFIERRNEAGASKPNPLDGARGPYAWRG